MKFLRRAGVGAIVGALLWANSAGAADWPQWRGPERSGHSTEKNLPLTWGGPEKANVRWKVPVDFGHSSPIVLGDRIYFTASVKRLPKEKNDLAEFQTHRVACHAVADGARVWQTDIEPGTWDTMFSFTSPTPVTDGKKLFAYFGSAVFVALDLEGKILWRKTLPGPFKAEWLCSSPLLFEETLYIFCDVNNTTWLFALDARTGDVKWERARPQNEKAHNSSPLLVRAGGRPQLVVASPGAVLALDPQTARELWTCKWNANRYPSLVAAGELVFATGEGGESLAIDPTGEGDVSKTHVKWRLAKTPQGFGSPIVVGAHIYRASPPGIIRCWKVATGELVFEERVEGVPTYTSPVATPDERIYFAGAGTSCVIKAGPQLEVLATNALGEGEKTEGYSTGPSAAVSAGRIFLRGPKALLCIGAP